MDNLEEGGKTMIKVVYDINGDIIDKTSLGDNMYNFARTDECKELPDTLAEDTIAHEDGRIDADEEDDVSNPDSCHNTYQRKIKFEDFLPEDTKTFEEKSHHMAEEKSSLEENIPEDTFTEGALNCFFYVSAMDEAYFKAIARKMIQYALEEMLKKDGCCNKTVAGDSFSKNSPS